MSALNLLSRALLLGSARLIFGRLAAITGLVCAMSFTLSLKYKGLRQIVGRSHARRVIVLFVVMVPLTREASSK